MDVLAEDMGTKTEDNIRSVETSIDIIKTLKESGESTLTEISEQIDVSKPTILNHLRTLEAKKFVVRHQNTYRLSLQFIPMGEYVRNQNRLYQAGKEVVDSVAESTGEYVHLSTEQHARCIKLHKSRGEQAVGRSYHKVKLQNNDYLHCTAIGKAVLAYMTEEYVYNMIDMYGLPERTKHTITESDRLFSELERIRERGYATNDEEEIRGIRAVAAPIFSSDGEISGSISISGPIKRFNGNLYHDKLPSEVIESASMIEAELDMLYDSDLPKIV